MTDAVPVVDPGEMPPDGHRARSGPAGLGGLAVVLIGGEPNVGTAEVVARVARAGGHVLRVLEPRLVAGLVDPEVLDGCAAATTDVVLVDLDAGGDLDLVGRLRALRPDLHLLTVEGPDQAVDAACALDAGADDHLPWPFAPRLLAARLRVVARRRPLSGGRPSATALRYGDLVVEPVARRATLAGLPLALTRRELDLLLHLARNPRRVISREELLEHAWRSSSDWQGVATVTEHIRRLRPKLHRPPAVAPVIATVRGDGYRFDPPEPSR